MSSPNPAQDHPDYTQLVPDPGMDEQRRASEDGMRRFEDGRAKMEGAITMTSEALHEHADRPRVPTDGLATEVHVKHLPSDPQANHDNEPDVATGFILGGALLVQKGSDLVSWGVSHIKQLIGSDDSLSLDPQASDQEIDREAEMRSNAEQDQEKDLQDQSQREQEQQQEHEHEHERGR
jgi:hypothetical protein